MGVNKVILLGNLGKDPELKYTTQQFPICSFSLATGDRKKDASGNWVDVTEWHNIVVLGKQAENCANFLKKGRQAFIEGKIQTRKWQDKEGKDRYTTEIVAQNVQFIGGKGEGATKYSVESTGSSYGGGDVLSSLPTADEISAANNSVTFEDDDIPF